LVPLFPECHGLLGTRGTLSSPSAFLPRVQHSGKSFFPECPIFGTRGSPEHSGNFHSPVVMGPRRGVAHVLHRAGFRGRGMGTGRAARFGVPRWGWGVCQTRTAVLRPIDLPVPGATSRMVAEYLWRQLLLLELHGGHPLLSPSSPCSRRGTMVGARAPPLHIGVAHASGGRWMWRPGRGALRTVELSVHRCGKINCKRKRYVSSCSFYRSQCG
jgi:hypothetical protein